jgi:opacity protein-like surface antigen
MKSAKTRIAIVFMLAASVAPAMAADWGGVKDMGGGVPIPVPAPAPVPTYDADSDWYIGLMLGGNISTSATIKDTDIDYLGGSSPGHFARDSGDVPMSPTFGLMFGRYITPSLRWEVAVDYTPDTQISPDQRLGYVATNSAPNFTAGVGGIDTNFYNVARTDTVKLSRTTALFNLLYDIPTGTRFTPYIGGGVGFSWRRIRRSFSETSGCIAAINSIDGPYPEGTCSGNSNLPSGSTISGSDSKNQIDLAAAVQAGVATNLTESIIWDNGWQMLWEGGSVSSSAPSVAGNNEFVFKDSVLQQFRSGLRIKFD